MTNTTSLAYRIKTGDEESVKRTSWTSDPWQSKNPPKFKAIIMRKKERRKSLTLPKLKLLSET
jgi:hypothetical protein